MSLFDAYVWFSAHAGLIFGGLAVLTFGLAVAAYDLTLLRVGLVLLLTWLVTAPSTTAFGYHDAPRWIASVDAVAAVMIAWVGHESRSRVALYVFALYGLVFLTHVACAVLQAQQTNGYYAVLNVLFLLQLIVVGGHSAQRISDHRRARHRQRLGFVHFSGAGLDTATGPQS